MPKAFSEHEKKIIQQRLMAAGEQQFSSYGFKKTNVEELAQAAGISKGAFYLFYPSKEALYMDVIEAAETDFRQQILTSIEQPGPSPRARLYHVLRQAFTLWQEIPVLQFFTSSDFDRLMRTTPPEQLQQHMISDQQFIHELVRKCEENGIQIVVKPAQIGSLFYALVLASLNQDFFDPEGTTKAIDILIELVAAYLLGEVSLEAAALSTLIHQQSE